MKIEKNVPLPDGTNTSPVKYPFRDMVAGDSVFVPGEGSTGRAATAARAYGYRNGKSFTALAVEGGVRIWMTGGKEDEPGASIGRPYGKGRYPSKYPFKDMEVGDEEFYKGQDCSGRAVTAAKVYGIRSGKRFGRKTVDGGVKIWRES